MVLNFQRWGQALLDMLRYPEFKSTTIVQLLLLLELPFTTCAVSTASGSQETEIRDWDR